MLSQHVFFFQAEDGIRDIGVTGVQTCALPIWSTPRSSKVFVCPRVRRSLGTAVPPLPLSSCIGAFLRSPSREAAVEEPVITRSEERRVGKEGRSRWSPYH